ncbi:hypothetical protein TNCV_1001051 [Trichonephila clavipes]|nr:hypothetical protein TNCV_1001051 [Trichonephila clavipes]
MGRNFYVLVDHVLDTPALNSRRDASPLYTKKKSNAYVTIKPDKVTSKVETSVPGVHEIMDTLDEEAPGLVVESIFTAACT